MFKILQKTFRAGIVTRNYPHDAPQLPDAARRTPEFDFVNWRDARTAAAVCPTAAITLSDNGLTRSVTVDYGRCIFCGECGNAGDPGVRLTSKFELAVSRRADLIVHAEYVLNPDGTHRPLYRGFG